MESSTLGEFFGFWTGQLLMGFQRKGQSVGFVLETSPRHRPRLNSSQLESIELHVICVIVHMFGSALELQRIMLMYFVRHLRV